MVYHSPCPGSLGKGYSYRYWFDEGDTTALTGKTSGGTAMEIDISSLDKGRIHALHFQALDARNKWGAAHTTYFFYTRGDESATARYWFDDETTRKKTSTVSGMVKFDVASLNCGVHALHFQMIDASGNDSPVQTAYFYKGAEGETARYWFDDEKTMHTASALNGIIELDIDHLTPGVHALHFQTFSTTGEPMPVHTQYFKKKDVLDLTSLSCRIWIDNDKSNAQTFSMTEDIIIDAPDLSIGMHDLHVILLDSSKQMLVESTTTFEVEDPDGLIPVSAFSGEEVYYNLAGQRVQKLQKGIYIKAGKKVLVK